MVHGTLDTWAKELSALAATHGLNPLPTEFHVVSDEAIYTLSSYLVPGRYRHWSYGERYWMAKQQDEQGLGRIYELVVNSDPSIAYLLDKNADAYNVLVMAHVLAHTDFFGQSRWLTQARRDQAGLWFTQHAEWLENLHHRHGFERAEHLIDAARTLYQLVDPHYRSPTLEYPKQHQPQTNRFSWVKELTESPEEIDVSPSGPPRYHIWPHSQDILALVAELGHLEDDERVALQMLRDEMLYFRPQQQTKVMNEGWATFWHVRLIREFSQWDDADHIEAMRLNANVTQPTHLLNPYYLGWTLWELLAEKHGMTMCRTMVAEETDQSWLSQWLTDDIVQEAQKREQLPSQRIPDPDKPDELEYYPPDELKKDIQAAFVYDVPQITIADIDSGHRLTLAYSGEKPLHPQYTQDVVNAIAYLWSGPVSLKTGTKKFEGKAEEWRRRG